MRWQAERERCRGWIWAALQGTLDAPYAGPLQQLNRRCCPVCVYRPWSQPLIVAQTKRYPCANGDKTVLSLGFLRKTPCCSGDELSRTPNAADKHNLQVREAPSEGEKEDFKAALLLSFIGSSGSCRYGSPHRSPAVRIDYQADS